MGKVGSAIKGFGALGKLFKDQFDTDVYHGTPGDDVAGHYGVIDVPWPDGTKKEVMVEMDSDDPPGINAFQGTDKASDLSSFPSDLGTWVSADPDVASYFAGTPEYGSPTVYRLKMKMKNPKIYDTYEDFEDDFDVSSADFVKRLKEQGHDGIMIENSTTDVTYWDGNYVGPRADYVVFDGNQLRVPWAKFDPSKADSKRILAGGAGVSTVGLTGAPDGQD
jgi:hypothetical protein